ncbi:hypothetical protein [Klebsiella quasipneumoniae]|uniref:hypothetical protein n=1 Tax=Klebsiella quasipneumoniae TaxID=1463165 RepID=UPI001FB5C623|nr:hypothetical protein [Klebsiella quasipneumoniae]MCJ1819612.1 hypothetical protein [Klebsiella quasipneumoniae subsp. similipneumoniae]
MKLLQWTLFIDMLGYREINGSINTEDAAQDFVNFMEMNKGIFDIQNNKIIEDSYKYSEQFDLYQFYDIKYAFVSDSFILTFYPLEVDDLTNHDKMYMHSANALFIITMRLQTFIFNCFSEKGVFLRGGISNKYCYIKDSFAVGEGLIEAYKIESTIAIYPRIAFSEDIIANIKLMDKIKFLSNEMYNGNQLVSVDSNDGVYFLDYIGFQLATVDTGSKRVQNMILNNRKWFDEHLKVVEDYVKKHSSEIELKLKELKYKRSTIPGADKHGIDRIIEKFEWLRSYHNSKVCKNSLLSHLVVN